MTVFWTGDRIGRALGAPVPATLAVAAISTDTRSLAPGDLFVALVGERFDGHAFLGEAAARGAGGAVVRRGVPPTPGLVHIEVDDPLVALGRLARERRAAVTGPVVAVTGTNGKTAIKEMLALALGVRWTVHATEQNLNNLIGVPLTILSAPDTCQALVVEVGASEPGEIARARGIIGPTVAVVSNVSAAHLAGFGSIEGVLEEKASLLDGVSLAVVGTDPPALADRAAVLAERVVTAGLSERAEVRPEAWGLNGDARGWCAFRGVRVELPIVGLHQLENAAIVLAVASALHLDLAAVADALGRTVLPAGRCEVARRGGFVIVQDTYNANPGSVTALLETGRAMRRGRPMAVALGSMLELGTDSRRLHETVADQVMLAEPQWVAVTGEFIPAFTRYGAALGEHLICANDPESLGRELASRLGDEALILVKGSRGAHMERALPPLLSSDETPCSTTC